MILLFSYHKFTKGKDLTQYKSEELACILGKGVKDKHSSKGLDMKEYFKTKREYKKLKLKLDKSYSSSNEDSVDIDNDKINERTTTWDDFETDGYVDETKISTTPPQKKTKYELKLTKEIETSPSNKYDNFEMKKKKKKSKERIGEHLKDIGHTEDKLTKITSDEDVKQIKVTNSKRLSDNVDDSKQSKRKIPEPLSDENLNETEQKIKKINNADDDAGNCNGECDSDDYKKTDEQNSESVLTHKYQNLIDLLIENSSAGKKYSKDMPSSLFEKKMKEFAESVKHQLLITNTIDSVETQPVGKEPTSVKLNPDDKDFIKNFEAQKSEVLENIRKQQEWTKYKNDTSQFVAKYGNVLFFGSNINNIKGYGEW